jgi:hypothetical protein
MICILIYIILNKNINNVNKTSIIIQKNIIFPYNYLVYKINKIIYFSFSLIIA